jgi:hypothetical protein
MKTFAAIGLASVLWSADAVAQDREHNFVLQFGPTAEWPLRRERANYGGEIAIEKELIEGWLEIEAGFSGFGATGRELSADLAFKKPLRLSPAAEFAIGAGPSISRGFSGDDRATKVSITFALEFIFWLRPHVAWFVEPSFAINPASGAKSFGTTGGLAIGFD